MFINCSKYLKDSLVKVYNIDTTPFVGLKIYITSESYDVYDKALSAGLSLCIDDTKFSISKNNDGESLLNPIVYKRSIPLSKLRIHDVNDNVIGLIVGSEELYGEDILNGINIDDLNDSVRVSIDWPVLDKNLLDYISNGLIIAIDPIYLSTNSFMFNKITNSTNSEEARSFGTGSYGLGAYGGTA